MLLDTCPSCSFVKVYRFRFFCFVEKRKNIVLCIVVKFVPRDELLYTLHIISFGLNVALKMKCTFNQVIMLMEMIPCLKKQKEFVHNWTHAFWVQPVVWFACTWIVVLAEVYDDDDADVKNDFLGTWLCRVVVVRDAGCMPRRRGEGGGRVLLVLFLLS